MCCSALDATDRRFKPCACGYQLCAWCWHQLMEQARAADAAGRCPACRAEYDERSIRFDAPSEEELAAESRKRTGREPTREAGASVASHVESRVASRVASRVGSNLGSNAAASVPAERAASGGPGDKKNQSTRRPSAADRKRLFDVRVIRRNLVYVVGLTPRFCEEASLRETRIFQKFGEVLKIHAAPPKPGAAPATGSAYVTFADEAAAARCVRGVDRFVLDGQTLRASFGTTKYCTNFLRGAPCHNKNCLYLHEGVEADDHLSFTKEEMLAQYGSKNTRAFQDAARGGAFRNGNEAERPDERTPKAPSVVRQKPFGNLRGADAYQRSAPRARPVPDRAATGIKGGIPAPRRTGREETSTKTAASSGVETRPAASFGADKTSSFSSTAGPTGEKSLGLFGAGRAPVPAPLGDAAPRETSRFTFAAENARDA